MNRTLYHIRAAWRSATNSLSPAPSSSTWGWMPFQKERTPTDLSTYIAPVALQRFRQDVMTWRQAVQMAENRMVPQRVEMMRMYYDTVLNGHVTACIEKRINLSVLREFAIVSPSGAIFEEQTAMLQEQWFSEFVKYCVEARMYGYSLIALGDVNAGKMEPPVCIPRHHVSPDRRNVTTYVYSISGQLFDEDPFVQNHIFVTTPSDSGTAPVGFGLLYKVAVYEIFMRNLLGFNGDFVEMFGMPIRVAKTTKTQKDPERQVLEQMLQMMGSSGYAILDPNDELELVETGKSMGKGQNPYENLEDRCMKFISKVMLGHADAVDSTAGKLGGDQGEDSPVTRAIREVQSVDGKFIENIVNGQLLPRLRNMGFRIPENARFRFMNNEELQRAKERSYKAADTLAGAVQKFAAAGYSVDPAWITEQTGVPVSIKPAAQAVEPMPAEIKNRLNQLYGGHRH